MRAIPTAGAVLGDLGYHDTELKRRPAERTPHATTFVSRDESRVPVDLHHSLAMGTVPAAASWEMLAQHVEAMMLAGYEVQTLDCVGRCMLLALHAVQHGSTEPKPLEDLRRGIAAVPAETWDEARALAGSLGAEQAFDLALAIARQPGETLATTAAWAEATPNLRLVALGGAAPGSLSVEHAMELRWKERTQFAFAHAFPSRSALTASDPGPRGYAGALARRHARIARQVLPAWRAARAVRRPPVDR